MEENSSDSGVTRRDFLSSAAMTVGLVLSIGTAAIYSLKYLVPAKKKAKYVDILVGNVKGLPNGASLEFLDGMGKKAILINNDGKISAFSKICTHLGCEVEWEPEKKEFFCPCHHGYFNANGKNIAGPPPRPLDKYKVTIKDGNIFVSVREV
jgi:cytochrome b6-f complex iron-sulfur subunit